MSSLLGSIQQLPGVLSGAGLLVSCCRHRTDLCPATWQSSSKHNQKPAKTVMFLTGGVEVIPCNLYCVELLRWAPNNAQVVFPLRCLQWKHYTLSCIEVLTAVEALTHNFLFRGGLCKGLQEKRPLKVNCDLWAAFALVSGNNTGNVFIFWADVHFNYGPKVYSLQHNSGPWPWDLCWMLK